MEVLSQYSWPGNVRELSHVIERACVLCEGPTISLEHFPEEIRKRQMLQQAIPALMLPENLSGVLQNTKAVNINQYPSYISEKDEIIDALKRARGNKSRAARLLNIDRSTLYRKMQRHEIQPDDFT
jgi:transcriptional regulator of acetoin/glycerol metabolism